MQSGNANSAAGSSPEANAANMRHAASEKIDEARGPVAERLESAASALDDKAESLPGGEKVTKAAHTAAKALDSGAEYLRNNDLNSMIADVQNLVRKNPGPALLTAAVLGFLVARTVSRD